GTSYGVFNEWAPNLTSGANVPSNVTIGNGANTTLSFGAANQFRQLTGNLIISGGSFLQLSTVVGGDLQIGGNWTATGTFTHNNRRVTFNGTAAQTINTANSFSYITIANTAAN